MYLFEIDEISTIWEKFEKKYLVNFRKKWRTFALKL